MQIITKNQPNTICETFSTTTWPPGVKCMNNKSHNNTKIRLCERSRCLPETPDGALHCAAGDVHCAQ